MTGILTQSSFRVLTFMLSACTPSCLYHIKCCAGHLDDGMTKHVDGQNLGHVGRASNFGVVCFLSLIISDNLNSHKMHSERRKCSLFLFLRIPF
jgi:hypothetical protein